MAAARVSDLLRRLGVSGAEAAAVALLAAGAVAALALLWVLSHGPPAGSAATTLQVTGTAEGAPSEQRSELVVHVAGLVRRPGLIRLAPGARVADAVAAAGGARPGAALESLNLARPLLDGEQLLVSDTSAQGPIAPAGTPSGAPAPAASGTTTPAVSLNQADVTQLEQLPGIGPVLAQRIVDHRDSVGGFTAVGDLRDISGIGEKTFQALAPLVTL